ncbi:hypothetical protein [Methylobacterium radiodurans]|uniref:Uncharacterized protein n=1 Tax=Methylobacterium radiodurans TaxID=2202828 RepID=A0A2U8VSE1_9HYPH|nr:hypothetical protein [Methylobacterium radiodurans]AWN36709.1 hypothetical protein DK427_14005 [Methylobacterium radiodurans]
MREAAEHRAEPFPGPNHPAGLTPLQRLVALGDQERIVHLFGTATGGADLSDPEADLEGPAAIQLIREAGGRIRRERAEAEAAGQRARAAEAAAETAEHRAETAEAALAVAQAAAEAAEARALRAEEEANSARDAAAEARLWLRRLVACLKTEFEAVPEA